MIPYADMPFPPKPKIPKPVQYYASFVDLPSFEDKRLDRYIDKMKQYLMENLVKVIFTESNLKTSSIEDFITSAFLRLYPSKGIDLDFVEQTLFISAHVPSVIPFPPLSNKDIETFIKGKSEIQGLTFKDIIAKEIKKVSINWIRARSILTDDTVDKSFYAGTLPDKPEYAMPILSSILGAILVDVEYLFCDEVQKSTQKENKKIEALKVKQKELTSKIRSLTTLNARQERELLSLKSNLTDGDSPYLSEIEELTRQNSKLQTRLDKILSKYETLKQQVQQDVEEDVEPETVKSVDLNGRYLFIVSNHTTFRKKVVETFPNARFCNASSEVPDLSNIDMVIVITSHIDHPTYNFIKKKCKDQNIPWVHCDYTNVELIKEVIMS